jgi:hypothetical protein
VLGAANLLFLLVIRAVSLRLSRSYNFKTSDFMARRSSIIITCCSLAEILLVFLSVLVKEKKLGLDINSWIHLVFALIICFENFSEFSYLNITITKLNGTFGITYVGICIMNLLIFYLDHSSLYSFDLSFAFMVCLPLFVLCTSRLMNIMLKRIVTMDFDSEKSIHKIDLGIRILLLDMRSNKGAKNSGKYF